jgi:hypothetical protein
MRVTIKTTDEGRFGEMHCVQVGSLTVAVLQGPASERWKRWARAWTREAFAGMSADELFTTVKFGGRQKFRGDEHLRK